MQGILNIKTNEQLIAEEQAEALKKAQELAASQPIPELSGYIFSCWSAARDAKESVKNRMLQAKRQREGEYDPDVLAGIQESGGSAVYMLLTEEKCTAAASWLLDFLLPDDGRDPWSCSSTPVPDLPPMIKNMMARHAQIQAATAINQGADPAAVQVQLEQMQAEVKRRMAEEARSRDDAVETFLRDQLVESGWRLAITECVYDITTYPAMILKGPVLRSVPELTWSHDGRPVIRYAIKKFWERVSPFDSYPAPGATDINDGYFIELHDLRRSDLQAVRGVPGYQDDSINAVIDQYGEGGLKNWLWRDREDVEGRSDLDVYNDPEGTIEALQFWGSVSGKMLTDWGVEVDDPFGEYEIEAWLIGNYVIKATINADPLGRRPYFKACWHNVPGQFWGKGIPEIIRAEQTQCNNTARSIANNMALASGPQVSVDVYQLEPGENYRQILPWKIWPFNSAKGGNGAKPVDFYQPNPMVEALLRVYQFFSGEAASKTVPAYAYGSTGEKSGAANTASGMSMMLSGAAKIIKAVLRNIDIGVIEPSVQYLHDWIRINEHHPELWGDIKIVARGAASLVAKEQQALRRNEALQVVLGSPIAQGIIGERGIAELLRAVFSGVDMGGPDIVPSDEELNQRMAQQQAMVAAQAQQQQQAQRQAALNSQVNQAGDKVAGQDVALFQGAR